MLENINILKTASAMARHAASRHQLVAQNIANADTANYKAKDLEPFHQAYERLSTRADPISGSSLGQNAEALFRVEEMPAHGAASPNGNTVSLENQIMLSAKVQGDHQAATAIYAKSLNILRMSLDRNS